jgi:hypothetical protein
MLLCQYKNAFGKARQGIHQYRVFDRPVLDWIVTLILVYVLSIVFRISLPVSFVGTMVLMVAVHLLFCADTAFETWIRKQFF